MTFPERAELHRRVSLCLGWKFGTRDECAPTYRDNLQGVYWWYEGWPYADAEVPEWTGDDIAVRLLKMMPWPEVTRFKGFPNGDRGWMVVPNWDNPALNAVDEELGVAIVLAFLSWFDTLSEEEREAVRKAAV